MSAQPAPLVVGLPGVLRFRPELNGSPVDLEAAGGTVTRLRLWAPGLLRTDPPTVDVGPAVRQDPTEYDFAVPALLVPGIYLDRVEYLAAMSGPPVTVDGTTPVYAFTGETLPEADGGDVGLVRLLISDLAEPRTFTDGDLQQLLDLEGGVVRLAAATALDTIAANETLVLKRITSLDLTTDGPAVAKALQALAASLRAQHTASIDGSYEPTGAFEFTTRMGTRDYHRGGYVAELAEHEWFG